MENEAAGAFVVWYFVSDLDLDLNGETEVSVEPSDLFMLKPEDGLVVTRVIFDREEQDSYQLTLTACDKGTPKR